MEFGLKCSRGYYYPHDKLTITGDPSTQNFTMIDGGVGYEAPETVSFFYKF